MALGNFTLDIQRFVDKAQGNIDLVVRKVALDMFRRVIMKSPVDTGRFKGNWQVAIGSIPNASLLTTDKRGGPTITKAAAVVQGMQIGQVIYCINNVSYSRRLEFGWSKQAPAGMVRLTVAEYGGVVARAASEVPK